MYTYVHMVMMNKYVVVNDAKGMEEGAIVAWCDTEEQAKKIMDEMNGIVKSVSVISEQPKGREPGVMDYLSEAAVYFIGSIFFKN